MRASVRFEDEADAEYRLAGRWYEERRGGLGLEFFDAVDAAIDHIIDFPAGGTRVPRLPPFLPVRRFAGTRFPYHVLYLETPKDIRITGHRARPETSRLLGGAAAVALNSRGAHAARFP